MHSSLGSDKGLRASDESDNGSCPQLCPTAFGFAADKKRSERREGRAETISVHRIQLVLGKISAWMKLLVKRGMNGQQL